MSSVSSAVLTVGIIIVLVQVKLLKKQNRLNAFNSVLQQWGGKEEREARRQVIREFEFNRGSDLETLADDSRKTVEFVLGRCNDISFLALKGLISEKDIFGLAGPPMVQCWDKSENFIKARRKQVNQPEEGVRGCYMYPFQQFVTKNRRKGTEGVR